MSSLERKTITISKDMDGIVRNAMAEQIIQTSKTTSTSEIINSMLLGAFFFNIGINEIKEYQGKIKDEGFELRKTITINKKISREITRLAGFIAHTEGLNISESRLINILLVFAFEKRVCDQLSKFIGELKTDQFEIQKSDFENIPATNYQNNYEGKSHNIIPSAEDKNNEFKTTFQYDMKEESLRRNGKTSEADQRKQNQKHIKKSIQKEIAITVAAFVNSDGGKLFVGVSDDSEIIGIERDLNFFEGSIDKFTLTVKDYLKNILQNISFMASLEFEFPKKDDKTYLIIDVKKSIEPIYVNYEGSQESYVRMQASSEKMTPEEFFKYAMTHFSKN